MTTPKLIAQIRRLVARTDLHKAEQAHKPTKPAQRALKDATNEALRAEVGNG